MVIDRRGLLRSGGALLGAAMLPGIARAALPAEKRYGMVEISASGMTVSVYQLSREMLAGDSGMSGFERLAPRRDGEPYSVLASPLERGTDAAAAEETVALVAAHIQRLMSERGVGPSDITVVASSGVASFSQPLLATIRDRLAGRTGIVLDVITPREEARLAFDWIVPRRRRGEVLQFDIGSGNTKGGYYDRRGRKAHYIDLSAPYGTKTMAGAVKFRWPEVRTPDFGEHARIFYADTVGPLLGPQIEAAPAALRLPTLFLTGGIIWASAVILHPQEMAERRNWVALAPDDFARLGRMIADGTPYGNGLPASLEGEERARIVKTLSAIRNTFNPHQLAAGAALADGLARQLDFAGRKAVMFPTFANNGWISQYLIEKFTRGGIEQVA